jgi:dipeptidyl aminopeptidase/acylaminoacyl peptidase
MKRFCRLLLCICLIAAASAGISILGTIGFGTALAQDDAVKPPEGIEAQGIPKVPTELAQQVKRYTGAYGLPLAGWHPDKRELWVKGISSASWVARIEAPEAAQKTWIYLRFGGIYDVYFQPQAKYLIYNRDTDGDESFQMYLYNIENRSSTCLSEGKSRNTEFVWSNSGEKVAYSFSPAKGQGVNLSLINPFDPKSNRLLVESTGNYLKAYDWSPDDKEVVFCEFISNTQSKLWLVNPDTNGKRLLMGKSEKERGYFSRPRFSKDGKGIYLITDYNSDVRYLAYLNLADGQLRNLTAAFKWDVDEFRLSPDGKTIAFVINEDGISRLYLLDTGSGQHKPVTSLPVGIISGLVWHNNSTDLAFNFKSSRTPNDVYSLNAVTLKSERWSKSVTGGVDTEKLSQPELIRWKSFDGRTISGFVYRPPATFTGKRPVIIDIHGGPEEQYRPEYGYDDNYFMSELGVAKIYPNVRGSSGFGKAFLKLDDGVRREDAVKDIGALLDWIKTQPDLDADRVMLLGGSYGAYLALASAVHYDNRIRGVVSESGVSNLASFVANTEGWRRDVQRAEYGDERDPKIRTFMEKTAPLNNVQKIKKPLLIIHGQNDPRNPVSEAEAMVQAAKKAGNPVWYLLAKDEGHGFAKTPNRNYKLYVTILFVKEFFLK